MEKEKNKCACNHENCTHDEACACEECIDCGCGCAEPIIVEMEDMDGEKVKVQIVGTFDDGDKSYAVADDLDSPGNSYIFEVQSTDEGDMLVSIDDEKEFDRLCKVVEKLVSENTEK